MSTSYLDSLLGQNERVLLVSRQHWTILLRMILLEIVLILLIGVGATVVGISSLPALLAYLLLLIPLILLLLDVLRWWNRQYVVTNRRVIQISGVFNKRVIDSVAGEGQRHQDGAIVPGPDDGLRGYRDPDRQRAGGQQVQPPA